jgi:hypothetical protein
MFVISLQHGMEIVKIDVFINVSGIVIFHINTL